MREVVPSQLRAWLKEASPPLLLDVREPWEFDTCRIEGAVLIPMASIVGRARELDPERPTVVVCHHGVRSLQVAMYLERSGFADVINLSGGVAAWARQVDPQMPRYSDRGSSPANPEAALAASAPELQTQNEQQTQNLNLPRRKPPS